MNSQWHHGCAFTDSTVSGAVYLWDCNYSPAQQWTLGMMSDNFFFSNSSNATNDTQLASEVKYSQSITGKMELSDRADSGTGLCLHAEEEKNGQQVSLKKCDHATTWTMDYSLESYGRGSYRVSDAQLSSGGKCITTPGNDRSNGQILWLWECTELAAEDHYQHGSLSYYGQVTEGQVSQVLSMTPDPSGLTTCGDVTGDYVEGTLMQVWSCDSLGTNTNQEFVWWNVDPEMEI